MIQVNGLCNKILLFALLIFFVIVGLPLAAQPENSFRFFTPVSVEEAESGTFINAEFDGIEITVRSFDAIDVQQLQLLEQYVIEVIFNSMESEQYSADIKSVEILLSDRSSAVDVELNDLLISVNDIMAVHASELFQHRFTVTFYKSGGLPRTQFPDMLYDCGLFVQDEQPLLLETGFLGWAEISRQIREWIQEGWDAYDEDVLTFVYSNRVLSDADSRKTWDDVFILPPQAEPVSVSGLLLELSGANVLKYYGGTATAGFGSLTADLMYARNPERRPDQSNYSAVDVGWSAGMFFEWDPYLELSGGPIDNLGAGLSAAGNVLLYLPGLNESKISEDVFAVGAEMLLRVNLIPFFDGTSFKNDNDYLFHISPRLLLRLPITNRWGVDLAFGAPSFRLAAGTEAGFISFLTVGADVGLRIHYTLPRVGLSGDGFD